MARRRVAAALTGAFVALTLLGACNDSVPESATRTDTMYVALGDSYVSGAVGKGQGRCGRTKENYPHIVARELRPMTVRDASCGGATTANVLTASPLGGTTLPAQLDDVPAYSDVVTLGIGANDSNLYPAIFYGCFIAETRTEAACNAALAKAPAILAATRPNIVSTIAAIQDRAAGAKVVLVGYLRLAPESGVCPDLGATAAQVRRFAQVEALLAETQAAAAKEAGVPFVPVRDESAGHDACASDSWTNALEPERGDGILLHPRAAGMQAVARMVEPYVKDAASASER